MAFHTEFDMVARLDNKPAMKKSGTRAKAGDTAGVAATQLRSYVDRIERLEEEKKALAEDIKEVYGQAKSEGFDVKILRRVISIRRRDQAEVNEEETLIEVYMRALGMLPEEEKV
jgi:uncharacterized protein (UPF0335 family)